MQVFTWPRKKREFAALAFDATGRYLAAGGGNDMTVVWDAVTGAEHGQYQAAQAALGFSPVGNRLVLPTKLGLYAHDPDEEGSFAKFAVPAHIGALAVHPARDLAVCYALGGVRLTGLSAVPVDVPDPGAVWNIASVGDLPNERGHVFSLVPLGGELFASSECVYGPNRRDFRYRITVRSWSDGRVAHTLGSEMYGYGDSIFGSRHSTTLVIQSGIWLRLQSTDDFNAPARAVRNDGRKHFTGAAFHPSGRFLAATSNDTTVKLFDADSLEVVKTFTWDIGKLRSIAFSPDGALAAAGSDSGKVVVWDVDL
jgi:WD40 repeat protein